MIGLAATAAVLVLAALRASRVRDLVRAVLWLGLVLAATGAAYAQLGAGLLAAIQVMVYAGGVVTLLLFAVMLTAERGGERPAAGSRGEGRAMVGSQALLVVLLVAVFGSELPHPSLDPASQTVGRLFLTRHVLAFELLSVLLLAGMVGAIAISRRRDG